MFRTVQLCKPQLQNIKHGEHLSTQQPQETQEKYVYDVVDQSDALHDQKRREKCFDRIDKM